MKTKNECIYTLKLLNYLQTSQCREIELYVRGPTKRINCMKTLELMQEVSKECLETMDKSSLRDGNDFTP